MTSDREKKERNEEDNSQGRCVTSNIYIYIERERERLTSWSEKNQGLFLCAISSASYIWHAIFLSGIESRYFWGREKIEMEFNISVLKMPKRHT